MKTIKSRHLKGAFVHMSIAMHRKIFTLFFRESIESLPIGHFYQENTSASTTSLLQGSDIWCEHEKNKNKKVDPAPKVTRSAESYSALCCNFLFFFWYRRISLYILFDQFYSLFYFVLRNLSF